VLTDEAGQFGAFFLSFAVIARLWLAHHRLVESVGAYDRAFVLVNLLWILTIVVLPFATPGRQRVRHRPACGADVHRHDHAELVLPVRDRPPGVAAAGGAARSRRTAGRAVAHVMRAVAPVRDFAPANATVHR
jgi:hypothetical protein